MKEVGTVSICILGGSGSGKSSLIGALALFAEPSRGSKIDMHGLDPESVDYLDRSAAALRRGLPFDSSAPVPISFHFITKSGSMDAKLIDYPGAMLDADLRRMDRSSAASLADHLAQSDYVILLLDPTVDLIEIPKLPVSSATASTPEKASELAPSLAPILEAKDRRLGAMLTALSDRSRGRTASGRVLSPPLVAIVVSKADLLPEVRSESAVRDFVTKRTGAFSAKIARLSAGVRYFAISSGPGFNAGEPALGVEELFEWIAGEQANRRRAPWRRIAGILVFALILVAAAAWGLERSARDQGRQLLLDDSLAKTERLERSSDMIPSNRNTRDELFRERLDELALEAASAGEPRLDEIVVELERLGKAAPGRRRQRIEELTHQVDDRREALWLARILEAGQRHRPNLHEMVEQFDKQFPGSKRRGEIEEMRRSFANRAMTEAKTAVRLVAVVDAESMDAKATAIGDFLQRFGDLLDVVEVNRMRRAIELGKRFSKPDLYEARLKRTGNFNAPRIQHVKVLVAGELVHEAVSPAPATITYWDKGAFKLRWQVGQSVQVMLVSQSKSLLNFSYYRVAERWSDDPLALAVFSSIGEVSTTDEWAGVFATQGALLEIELKGFDAEDWNIAAQYLYPGERW